MVREYPNEKGFLIIEASLTELVNKCGFGIGNGLVVCDKCNTILKKDIQQKGIFGENDKPIYYKTIDNSKYYYVAVLNMLFCKDCVEHFIANSPKYDEDAGYELRHYERVARQLGLLEQEELQVSRPFNP